MKIDIIGAGPAGLHFASLPFIASGAVPCTKLDVIFRQKLGGSIVRNAHLVNAGSEFGAPVGDHDDFFFIRCEEPERILANVVELVKGHDFYRPAHEIIFDAITTLYGRGEPADAITVAAELTRQGEIGKVGGHIYIHDLLSSVAIAANAASISGSGPGPARSRTPAGPRRGPVPAVPGRAPR